MTTAVTRQHSEMWVHLPRNAMVVERQGTREPTVATKMHADVVSVVVAEVVERGRKQQSRNL